MWLVWLCLWPCDPDLKEFSQQVPSLVSIQAQKVKETTRTDQWSEKQTKQLTLRENNNTSNEISCSYQLWFGLTTVICKHKYMYDVHCCCKINCINTLKWSTITKQKLTLLKQNNYWLGFGTSDLGRCCFSRSSADGIFRGTFSTAWSNNIHNAAQNNDAWQSDSNNDLTQQTLVKPKDSAWTANVHNRDGRIVIFCRIPDSVNQRLISGRFLTRIFDATLPPIYTYKNYSKSRSMLYFSVIFNHQSCQIIKSLLIHHIYIVQCSSHFKM